MQFRLILSVDHTRCGVVLALAAANKEMSTGMIALLCNFNYHYLIRRLKIHTARAELKCSDMKYLRLEFREAALLTGDLDPRRDVEKAAICTGNF